MKISLIVMPSSFADFWGSVMETTVRDDWKVQL